MQIGFSITAIDIIQMRQILHNSGVSLQKCFRLVQGQFLTHDRDTLAQYYLAFADGSAATVEVYFDTISLRIKADVVEGVL